MRIVIDMQGAQTASRFRGIGRYTVSLVKAMVQLRKDHEIIIVLNGLYADTIEPIRAEFSELLPINNIRVWAAIEPIDGKDFANDKRRKMAELVRESFLASLKPDVVLISSLFEGFDENAVTSIGELGQFVPTAIVLYDLIPLIYREAYLQDTSFERWYENKLDHFRRADLLLAISLSSGREAVKYLNFSDQAVVNISTACDAIFHPMIIEKSQRERLNYSYGIKKPFVLYTGGIDQRKNISGLFHAFSQLPSTLRQKHQLVLVGRELLVLREHFINLALECGLTADELVLTGYVEDEELALLYNACTLFVFPSWHEGFGLPVLEAMNCGRAVIAANSSSLPEVVGRADALFRPHDISDMSKKMAEVIGNENFRIELEYHSLEQAKQFSWDATAVRAFDALHALHIKHQNKECVSSVSHYLPRPRLAYISPLQPVRSGIADYSAELLPELSRHYEIDVIVAQTTVTDPWVIANSTIRDVDWFLKNSYLYDRVLYHFGNSQYHQHMFDLLEKIPGVVVLHDFFLSGVTAWILEGIQPNKFVRELYHGYGYKAVHEYFNAKDISDVVWKYPCNKTVLENTQGVIVHSENSQRLAEQWLGKAFAKDWFVIPHLRNPIKMSDWTSARLALGLDNNAFIISSFGLLNSSKQNHRLLEAWLASPLSKDKNCLLVFVGENQLDNYGMELETSIRKSGLSNQVRITGWTDTLQFRQYLAATDVGVQLRTLSRGETSGTVLDCMNYGLPTIVNANGSMADLPSDAVWMLPDEFKNIELIQALTTLWKDKLQRDVLGKRAREVILTQHSPRICGEKYVQAIERYYAQAQSGQEGLIKAISKIEGVSTSEQDFLLLAQSIAQNQPPLQTKQLLIDISALVNHDLKTGIQRVVRSILVELLKNQPKGYRVEPIYATAHQMGYRYARQFTLKFLDCPDHVLIDGPVEIFNGDIFLGLDLQPDIIPQQTEFYAYLMRIGVKVYFMIYDLLPVLQPQVFPEGTFTGFSLWLNTIVKADGAVCISHAVADEMIEWLSAYNSKRYLPFKLGWFHLGADITSSLPTTGFPGDYGKVLVSISSRITFLMVGTIEPRKGYLQTILAFEQLWAYGVDVNLVIVGNEGWKPLPDNERRTIPEIVTKIQNSNELNHRLFWLEGISDEYLEKIYTASACLIAASEGEGFGLPLIEAAQHKLPIIARDIPVFREVSGNNAYYFSGLEAADLVYTVNTWLMLDKENKVPQSYDMPWLTWQQSVQNLLNVVLENNWYTQWMPSSNFYFWGSDSHVFTQVGKRTGLDMTSMGQEGYLIYGHYIPIVANMYRVNIYGTLDKFGLNGAYMDMSVAKGNFIVDKFIFGKTDENGCMLSVLVTLDVAYDDFEIRIWVSEGCILSVHKVEIKNV